MPADASEPVLRLASGERVFDVDDVPAILALAELAALIDRKWVEHTAAGELPSTAVTRHREETGHRLRFGCCQPHGRPSAGDVDENGEIAGMTAAGG